MALIEERGTSRGGVHTRIVIHRPIAPFVYFPTASLSFAMLFFFHTALTKQHLSLCVCLRFSVYMCEFVSSHAEQHKTSASFLKMQIASICGPLLSESG